MAQCFIGLGLLNSIIIGGLSNISGSAADDGLRRPLAVGERPFVLRKPGLKACDAAMRVGRGR
jgi:hypothetical protein